MSNAMSLNMVYTDYLSHHGIMGMKWGKRNGPPYPLAPGDHSASEKKANWEQSLDRPRVYGSDTKGELVQDPKTKKWRETDHKKTITDADRKYLIDQLKKTRNANRVAAAVTTALGAASAAALAVGPEMVPLTVMTNMYMVPMTTAFAATAASASKRIKEDKAANELVKQYEKERENSPIDTKTGLRVKQSEMSIEEDVKRINPAFKDVTRQSKANCVLCSVTYDLRRRGYDVTAQGAGVGYVNDEVSAWYNNKIQYKPVESNRYAQISTDKIVNALKQEGGRGIVNVQWPGGGGHAMAYDNDGGSLKIIDGQSGDVYTDKTFTKAFKHAIASEYARTDNLKINAKEMLKEVCKN